MSSSRNQRCVRVDIPSALPLWYDERGISCRVGFLGTRHSSLICSVRSHKRNRKIKILYARGQILHIIFTCRLHAVTQSQFNVVTRSACIRTSPSSQASVSLTSVLLAISPQPVLSAVMRGYSCSLRTPLNNVFGCILSEDRDTNGKYKIVYPLDPHMSNMTREFTTYRKAEYTFSFLSVSH